MGRTSDARERLIHSAIELIHARSYADVGVNDLCEHAGVKKGSFYHFFPSKRDLIVASLDEVARWYARDIYEPAFAADLAPLERIQRIFQLVYEYHASLTQKSGRLEGCHFGNLAVELSTQDEIIRDKVRGMFESSVSLFEGILRDAVDSGDLPEIDITLAAHALLAYMEGIVLLAKTWNDPEMVRRLAHSAVQLARAGAL